MRRIARALFAILGVAVIGAFLAGADSPATATSPALHALTFIDDANGMSLRVQLDLAASDAGHWTMRVAGGVYSGDASGAMKINSATSSVINYEGPASFRPLAGFASTRSIRLHAQLDAAHHTAEAKLWDGNDQFQLVARAASTTGLTATIALVEQAIVRDDVAGIYALANSQVTRAYDANAFAATWAAQTSTYGRVTALRQTSVGSPQATDQGFWYVAVSYSADIVTPQGSSTAAFTAFFIREDGGWKLWTTTRR